MFWKKRHPEPRAAPLEEIVRHFNQAAADEENFPATIDPRIYHVHLILEYFGDLNGERVLDVGCGKGRFARVLAERYPQARMVGLDLAEAMLRHLPAGVSACAGSMTALPFPAAAFDCVYATESLEHAVDIDLAVAEMCRVVRPGGRGIARKYPAGRFRTGRTWRPMVCSWRGWRNGSVDIMMLPA
jgi:ubiquinone/menaquinone biosynthesis C-methylase UbiE